MQIKFREYNELSAEERQDGIEAARWWLRFNFPLLLPCDISDACRIQIVNEAGRVQRERDTSLDKAWRQLA